jgi:quinolinate synthase
MGVLFKLKRDNPEKSFYLLSPGLVCPNMKKTSLLSVYSSLNEMKYEINLDETVRLKAKRSLDNMLKLS